MIFLDSTYLIGLILKTDSFTEESHKLKHFLGDESKVINNTVLNEVLNSLTSSNHSNKLDEIKDLLLSYNIDYLDEKGYLDSFLLFKFFNYSLNFADCTILKTMMDWGITNIVSFDSDFDKVKGIKRIHL